MSNCAGLYYLLPFATTYFSEDASKNLAKAMQADSNNGIFVIAKTQ